MSLMGILLVLVSTGTVSWVFHSKVSTILVDNALQAIAVEAEEAGGNLRNIVNNHDEDILFLASTPPFQGILRARSSSGIDELDSTTYSQWTARLETIFESLLERKENYYKIRFIDNSGQELVSVYRSSSELIQTKAEDLQNKAHRPYVEKTLELADGDIYLSEINLNREYGQIVVPHQQVFRIATPVYDERNNTIAGLVVVTFEAGQALREIQGHVRKDGDGVIYITNEQGGYLLHPDMKKAHGSDLGTTHKIQQDIPQLARYFLPNSSVEPVTLMPDESNGRDVVSITKIFFDKDQPQRFIGVVMTRNYKGILAEESVALNDIIWVVLLLIIGSTGIAVLFSIHLARPIRQMTLAVKQFTDSPSIPTNLPLNSTGEIGTLAQSFKTMIQQIEQSQGQLEQMNLELESRVETRTEDLDRARIEAERANQAKSEFLSRMSHELRTPMNAILGFGQILELDIQGFNANQSDCVKEILNAGHHLLQLINEILDLAQIESGKLAVVTEAVDIDEILEQSLGLIQPLAAERGLTIDDQISGKGYSVQADAVRFKQILLNLLSNAVKYNRTNGHITLDSELINKQHLRIRITDNGLGLSDKNIRKLFTSFERLEKQHNIEGAGIGLVISKHLIELMGGVIGVESTLDKGSTFWIDIPLNQT